MTTVDPSSQAASIQQRQLEEQQRIEREQHLRAEPSAGADQQPDATQKPDAVPAASTSPGSTTANERTLGFDPDDRFSLRVAPDPGAQRFQSELAMTAPSLGEPLRLSTPASGQSRFIEGSERITVLRGMSSEASVTQPLSGDPEAPLTHLADAESRAREAWATLPPDTVHRQTGASGLADEWRVATQPLVGPGDPSAVPRSLRQNAESFADLERVVSGPGITRLRDLPGDASRQDAYLDQLYAPAIGALSAENPNATFRLVAVEQGTLPGRAAPGVGGTDSQLAIEMRNGEEVKHYFLNPGPLFMAQGSDGPAARALANDPALAQRWYESGRANGVIPPAADRGNAQDTLRFLADRGAQGLVVDSAMTMSHADQIEFLRGFGRESAQDPRRPLGGLLIETDRVNSSTALMSVDASPLARGERPSRLDATFNVGAVDGLEKMPRFIDQNYDAIVGPSFARYAALRGDETRTLSGTDLPNEIGAAMKLQPNNIPRTQADWERFNRGDWSLYAGEASRVIDPVARQIRAIGGADPNVTALPVVFDSKETGMVELPLFRVESGGRTSFVDNLGRSYSSIQDWRDNNKLPPGRVSYPEGGHITTDASGAPRIRTEPTHAVIDTPGEAITSALDTAALVGGFVVGAAAVVGTGGAALPVAAGAIAAWGAYRTGGDLFDRATHGQTLNPFESPEARNAWLNFGANLTGLAALGSAPAARALSLRSSSWAEAASSGAGALSASAQIAGTGAVLNQGVDLVENWDRYSPEQRALAVSQLAFWSGGVTHQVRQAGGIRNIYSADAVTNRLHRDLTRYGAIDREGFPRDPDFGRSMYAAVESANARIDSGSIRSARDLWGHLRDWRAEYSRASGESSAWSFSQERVTPEHEALTPLRGERYRHLIPRLNEEHPGSGWLEMSGEINGERIPLSTIAFSEQGGNIFHTSPEQLPKVWNHVEGLYQRALDPRLSQDEVIDTVASMHWWMTQAMPDHRGSAAKADAMARTLLERRGIPAPPWRQGVVPDLEAIITPHDEFVARYRGFFIRDPR